MCSVMSGTRLGDDPATARLVAQQLQRSFSGHPEP
jgi:hypothetical protein